MEISHPIHVEMLRLLLRLDDATGRLFWLPRPPSFFAEGAQTRERRANIWNGKFAAREAMTYRDNTGYRRGALFNRLYQAHRVVFALHNGLWPVGSVDHIDGDRENNRPLNLRGASQQENCRNQRAKVGSSAFKGVSWAARRSEWVAMCRDRNGRYRRVGAFSDEKEAAMAYDAFAKREHGPFARLNFPG